MSYLLYREVLPTSNVVASLFFTPTPNNPASKDEYLVTASISAVNIYRVHERDDGGTAAAASSSSSTSHCLGQVFHSSLFGKVQDVQVFTYKPLDGSAAQEQLLLFSIDFGKFVLTRFSPATFSLDVLNVFNAEENAVGMGTMVRGDMHGRLTFSGTGSVPYLAIDSHNRLACAVLYSSELFFMPLAPAVTAAVPSGAAGLEPVESVKDAAPATAAAAFAASGGGGGSAASTAAGTAAVTDTSTSSNTTAAASAAAAAAAASTSMQFLIDLYASLQLPGAIIDLQFLSGYQQPALAILQEMGSLPLGHVAVSRYTCAITVIAVDVARRAVSVIWQQRHLPHDSIRLVNVPSSILGRNGGILLVSMNAVLAVAQEGVVALAGNGFAGMSVSPHITVQPWEYKEAVEFDASQWIETSQGSVVGALKSGVLVSIQLTGVHLHSFLLHNLRFAVDVLASSVRASSLSVNRTRSLWFLGSRQSECVLLRCRRELAPAARESIGEGDGGMMGVTPAPGVEEAKRREKEDREDEAAAAPSKRVKAASGAAKKAPSAAPTGPPSTTAEEETLLYGHQLGQLFTQGDAATVQRYSLSVADTIKVMGPILDACFCRMDENFNSAPAQLDWTRVGKPKGRLPPCAAASYIAEREVKDALQVCAGLDEQGGVMRVSRGVRFAKLALRNFATGAAVNFLSSPSLQRTILFLSLPRKTKVWMCSEDVAGAAAASEGVAETLAQSSLDMREMAESHKGFNLNDYTLATGYVHQEPDASSSLAVQVTAAAYRLVRVHHATGECECLQDSSPVDDKERIVSADVCLGWVVLVTSACSVFVLEYSPSQEPAALVLRHATKVGAAAGEGAALQELVTGPTAGASLFLGAMPAMQPLSDRLSSSSSSTSAADAAASGKGAPSGPRDDEAAVALGMRVEGEELYLYGCSIAPTGAGDGGVPASSDASDAEVKSAKGKGPKAVKGGKAAKPTKGRGKRKADSDEVEEVEEEEEEEQGDSAAAIASHSSSPPHAATGPSVGAHLVLWDLAGVLQVLALPSLRVVFASAEMGRMPELLRWRAQAPELAGGGSSGSSSSSSNSSSNSSSSSSSSSSNSRLLRDVRLAVIGRCDAPADTHVLVLAAVMVSGDVVAYRHNGLSDYSDAGLGVGGEGRGIFVKVHHSCVTRRKRNKLKAKAAAAAAAAAASAAAIKLEKPAPAPLPAASIFTGMVIAGSGGAQAASARTTAGNNSNSSTSTSTSSSSSSSSSGSSGGGSGSALSPAQQAAVLSLQTDEQSMHRLSLVSDLDGRSGLLISGSSPCFLFSDSGLPCMLPLSLPEVPYINPGAAMVCPFACGSIRGVATLWMEHDDGNEASRANKQAALEIYQEVPNCHALPGGSISGKRITVGKTVHQAAEFLRRGDDKTEQELLERKTFILACSEETSKPFVHEMISEADTEADLALRDRYMQRLQSFFEPDVALAPAPAMLDRLYSLVLTQGGEAVASYPLPEREKITGMEAVCLVVEKSIPQIGINKSKPAKRRVFVVVSTVIEQDHGEDSQGEGRLLMFALDYAFFQGDKEEGKAEGEEEVLADGAPSSGNSSSSVMPPPSSKSGPEQTAAQSAFFSQIQPKLKLHWTGPGPASVVKQLGEYIVTTVGCSLYVYKLVLDSLELEQVAFYYATFYIQSLSIMKDYIMIADAHKSVAFLSWKEDDFALILLGKDYNDCFGLSTAFVADGSSLGMLVGDDEGNIQLLQYAPKKPESKDGAKLLLLADCHLGSDANVLLSHAAYSQEVSALPAFQRMAPLPGQRQPPKPVGVVDFGTRFNKTVSTKICSVYGSTDGALGLLVPLEERVYRRLALLQQLLATSVKTCCYLNPQEHRFFQSARVRTERRRGLLDGSLLWQFVNLDADLQDDLAAAMGVTTDLLLDNLQEIDHVTNFF